MDLNILFSFVCLMNRWVLGWLRILFCGIYGIILMLLLIVIVFDLVNNRWDKMVFLLKLV